jgi:hypothetical protein
MVITSLAAAGGVLHTETGVASPIPVRTADSLSLAPLSRPFCRALLLGRLLALRLLVPRVVVDVPVVLKITVDCSAMG